MLIDGYAYYVGLTYRIPPIYVVPYLPYPFIFPFSEYRYRIGQRCVGLGVCVGLERRGGGLDWRMLYWNRLGRIALGWSGLRRDGQYIMTPFAERYAFLPYLSYPFHFWIGHA